MAPREVVVDAAGHAVGRVGTARVGRLDEVVGVAEQREVRRPPEIGVHHMQGVFAHGIRHRHGHRGWQTAHVRIERPDR